MLYRAAPLALLTVLFTSATPAAKGLVTLRSTHSVSETTDRLTATIEARGFRVVLRVDHAASARAAGLTLRETQLILFGNPEVGSQLMQCSQTMAIDLPQKFLVWEDESGAVWVGYNDPKYLAGRHGARGCDLIVDEVGRALAGLAQAATSP